MLDPYNNTITHEKVDGYRYFNYAILHTRGLNHVFDMMRYDTAFLCRKTDFERLLAAVDAGIGDSMLQRFSLLLCRYDWQGPTKAHWTPARLIGGQEYEFIDEPMKLVDLGSDQTSFRPNKPLKIKTEIEVDAKLAEILRIMYENKGIPGNESSARAIEDAFYHPADLLKVKLVNYQQTEAYWRIKP